MTHDPTTLGEALAAATPQKPRFQVKTFLRNLVMALVSYVLVLGMVAVPIWWVVMRPAMSLKVMLICLALMFGAWIYVGFVRQKFRKPSERIGRKVHSLLAHDRQGFMADLPLKAKTVIFDGSNIYHFGHSNGVDAQPLGLLAQQLRREGYRIISFFDANIFYTLQEHGAFDAQERHSISMLTDIFGLARDEIYVVPSGVQADLYVLNTLKFMPISFAVTNDQFRDYGKQFKSVMKGQWRKGVKISNGEVKLLQHKLEAPIRVG